MQVIHVRKRQESVERRVNGRGDAILTEGAQRIIRHHLVFVLLALVPCSELIELVQIQNGEPGDADRSQVAAASLDGHDTRGLSRERIGQFKLRASIAAAEIRNAEVSAQKVRAVLQFFERLAPQRIRPAVLPQVLQ